MKKKILISIIVLVVIVLIISIPKKNTNEGVIEYKALLYKITKVNLDNDQFKANGNILEIFGHVINNNVKIEALENELSLEDIKNEEGLLFTIERKDKSCVPVKLALYDDGVYELSTSYGVCKPFKTCASMLKYINVKKGTYDYEILKILEHSGQSDGENFLPMYELYTGKDSKRYITDDNNTYLNEFLSSINVNMNKCASKSYY